MAWLKCIEMVSDLTKDNWQNIWEYPLSTFLVYLKYAKYSIIQKQKLINQSRGIKTY